jgi:hypothetical protein
MVRPLVAIAIFLVLLAAIPYYWPSGFSEPPVLMIILLAVAAGVALVVGRRRRAKSWSTAPNE